MNPIYEDEEILVCEKPAGMATESANIRAKDMVSEVKSYLKGGYVGLIHRLDQPVSGLLVFAKTPAAAACLSKQIQNGDMKKTYLATVEGKLEKTKEPVLLTDYLIKGADGKATVVASQNSDRKAVFAKLRYEVRSYDPKTDTTNLQIDLLTGRYHQIRAQLSHIGHPVLRDVRYGAKKPADPKGPAGIALCAFALSFHHPQTGEVLHFQIPSRSL